MGVFEGEVSLKLSPDAKPFQLPPHAAPQIIMPELKKELDNMEQEGIFPPCPETTEWVHNIATVVKKDGSLRLCLDPRNLNKYLIRNVHYTASWEDALHSFKKRPKRLKSIAMLAAPKGKQELQSLLGTVNFMSTFIPNLSKKTHLIRIPA